MASQRITIAKIGGAAGEAAGRAFRGWADARTTDVLDEWSGEQWPADVRARADAFADRLRSHATDLPVVSFVEWSDIWSMFDLFHRWLAPAEGRPPLLVHGDRFELYGYDLPDGGRLERRLAVAGAQQFPEYDLFTRRLRESVEARDGVDRSLLVVLREVVGGLATDGEVRESLAIVPDWLAD